MNPPGNTPYRLLFSSAVGDELRDLAARAKVVRVSARFAAALGVIRDRLTNDPQGWGDPIRNYASLAQTVYRRMFDELLVNYTVHEGERTVWLHSVLPVLGHPLNSDTPQG